mmetsp:Transcript_9559/g.26803  ORF Transcript_9559/g.26803 Transcript_9559/m.26803 type:complete len:97 (+) Transcript_9559:3171-3461(+)
MAPTLTQSDILVPRLVLVPVLVETDTLFPLAAQVAIRAAIQVGGVVPPTGAVPVTKEPKVQALQVIMGDEGIDYEAATVPFPAQTRLRKCFIHYLS